MVEEKLYDVKHAKGCWGCWEDEETQWEVIHCPCCEEQWNED